MNIRDDLKDLKKGQPVYVVEKGRLVNAQFQRWVIADEPLVEKHPDLIVNETAAAVKILNSNEVLNLKFTRERNARVFIEEYAMHSDVFLTIEAANAAWNAQRPTNRRSRSKRSSPQFN